MIFLEDSGQNRIFLVTDVTHRLHFLTCVHAAGLDSLKHSFVSDRLNIQTCMQL